MTSTTPTCIRVTIHDIGALFATPEKRRLAGVRVLMVGKENPRRAKRDGETFTHGGLTWTFSRGDAYPTIERRPGGLRFDAPSCKVALWLDGARVRYIRQGLPGEFEVTIEGAPYVEVGPEAALEMEWMG